MATKIRIYFTLYGKSFNPDKVSDFLELIPAEIWHKGDYRAGSQLIYEDNGWSISTKEKESLSVSKEIDSLIKIIFPYKEKITSLITAFKLEAELGIVIHIENDEKPEIYFNNKLINIINSLSCSIDIDIY